VKREPGRKVVMQCAKIIKDHIWSFDSTKQSLNHLSVYDVQLKGLVKYLRVRLPADSARYLRCFRVHH